MKHLGHSYTKNLFSTYLILKFYLESCISSYNPIEKNMSDG